MRASTVVLVVNILFQNTPQMSLVENEDMIEALLFDGSHPTLGIGIGVGREDFEVLFSYCLLQLEWSMILPGIDVAVRTVRLRAI